MASLARQLSDMAGQWIVQESIVHCLSGGSATQICKANPLRWGLLIAGASTQTVPIALSTLPTAGTGKGFAVPANFAVPPIMITYDQWGGLVQSQWFCNPIGASAVDICVIELLAQTGGVS